MWDLLAAVGLVVLVAQLPAGSGELRRYHARPCGGAPASRLAFRLPPALTLHPLPGLQTGAQGGRTTKRGAGWEDTRTPGQNSVAHAVCARLLRGVVGVPSPALAGFGFPELRGRAGGSRAALTRCAAAQHAGNVTAAAPDVPVPEAKKAARKAAAKKSTAANKAAGRESAAPAAEARAKTPKRAAAKKAVGASKSAGPKVPERSPDQAPAPALEAGEQGQGPESAGGVGRGEGAEHAVQVKAPGAKPKRRARKMAWTDDALLVEFALKAVMLLREAGGELESSKFLLRWKCTFPSDQVSRYMGGRRLSVRQLLLQCGNTFTIADIPGSRTKKLFGINDEHDEQDQARGVWPDDSRGDEAAPTDKNATNTRQGSGLVSGSLLWAEPQALEEDETPHTRGDRFAEMRGQLGWGATDVVRVVKGGDRERPDAASMLEGLGSDEGFGECVEPSAPGAGLESSSAPSAASELATDVSGSAEDDVAAAVAAKPSDRSLGKEGEEVVVVEERATDEDVDGGEWDFEKDGRIPKEQVGASSELCCELAVGDDECAKNVQSGIELIQSFKDMGITFGNVLSYNALLDMCARAANDKTSMYATYALSILNMMADNHVQPNAESYGAVIRTCCQSRDGLFKAIAVLQDMRQAGMDMTSQDYYLLFDACAKEAQHGNNLAVEQGLLVLESMRQSHIVPDANRCLAMISVIPREGAWCNMCRDKILELMQEAGLDYPLVKQAMDLVRERNSP